MLLGPVRIPVRIAERTADALLEHACRQRLVEPDGQAFRPLPEARKLARVVDVHEREIRVVVLNARLERAGNDEARKLRRGPPVLEIRHEKIDAAADVDAEGGRENPAENDALRAAL